MMAAIAALLSIDPALTPMGNEVGHTGWQRQWLHPEDWRASGRSADRFQGSVRC